MENELSTNFQITPNFVMDSMLNPQIFEQLQRASTLFSKSGLVPDNFKNNPAACFVGLQLAGAIGCNPFMLFQGMYSIGGKIGLETKLAVAIANQKGVFSTPITHKFTGEGKTRSCTATATLAKSKKEVSITVDWEMVEKEGWNKKNGSKWNTMPDQMFRYRSSMWLIRTYAPEVLMGLSSLDELEDSRIIDITPKTKNIDDAFAEMAQPKAENVIEQQNFVNNQPEFVNKTTENVNNQPEFVNKSAKIVNEQPKSIKEVDVGTGVIGGQEPKIGWFWCENRECSSPVPIDKNVTINTAMCPNCHQATLHEASENTRAGAANERLRFLQKKPNTAQQPIQPTLQAAKQEDTSLIDTILAYGIKPSYLTVYIVKAIGTNKELESLTDDEAKKVLNYIQSVKGVAK